MSRPHISLTPRQQMPFHFEAEWREKVNQMPTKPEPTEPPRVPSVAELRRMLQSGSDLRAELLNEIREKLESGEYLTRAAATQSARRLLDSGEL